MKELRIRYTITMSILLALFLSIVVYAIGAPMILGAQREIPGRAEVVEAHVGQEGTEVLANEALGYRLHYPTEYTVEQMNEAAVAIVVGGLLNVEDPRLHIEVGQAAGRTAEDVAAELANNPGLPGMPVERSRIMLDGEEAIVVDNVVGQELSRYVVVVHEGILYRMMFAPVDSNLGDLYNRTEALYNTVLDSFHFLPATGPIPTVQDGPPTE